MLRFESAAFAVTAGEDERTNPGIFGRSLATWLSERLQEAGFPAGPVIAEDFAWCVPVDSSRNRLYVACASGGNPDEWQVFVFAEGRLMPRLLGKDERAESVASLFAAVRRCIETVAGVRHLREEAI